MIGTDPRHADKLAGAESYRVSRGRTGSAITVKLLRMGILDGFVNPSPDLSASINHVIEQVEKYELRDFLTIANDNQRLESRLNDEKSNWESLKSLIFEQLTRMSHASVGGDIRLNSSNFAYLCDTILDLLYSHHLYVTEIIERFIDESKDCELFSLKYEEKLKRIESYADKHGSEGLGSYVALLFPYSIDKEKEAHVYSEDSKFMLPMEAPETYQGLRGPETPPEFVQRVYGEWLGHGLTRAHIRKLDPVLSKAIDNWLSKPENQWPTDIDLPTKAEQNTRDLETLRSTASGGQLGGALGDFTAREAARIRSALQRREKKIDR